MIRAISDGNSFRRCLLLVIVVLSFIGVLRPIASQAQTCGTDYTIKEGETLAQIAARVYGNPAQWTIVQATSRIKSFRDDEIAGATLCVRSRTLGSIRFPFPNISRTVGRWIRWPP